MEQAKPNKQNNLKQKQKTKQLETKTK